MLEKPKHLTEFARQNRKAPTKAEALLWARLRGPRFDGLRFRRQHQIDVFIVDFCCLRARVVIELDGWSHDDACRQDVKRQAGIESHGFEFLRYSNTDVLDSPDEIAESISRICVECAKVLFGEEFSKRRHTGKP